MTYPSCPLFSPEVVATMTFAPKAFASLALSRPIYKDEKHDTQISWVISVRSDHSHAHTLGTRPFELTALYVRSLRPAFRSVLPTVSLPKQIISYEEIQSDIGAD